MPITQECCELYRTSPGAYTSQNSSLPTITKTILVRWTTHAGHWRRRKGELISDILLRTPSHERAKAGRLARTYIQQLCADTGYSLENLSVAMEDRDGWWERSRGIRAGSITWWFVSNSHNWNHLTVCKQKSSNSFKNKVACELPLNQ